MVVLEISFRQIVRVTGLVVDIVIVLRRITDEEVVIVVEIVINAGIVASVKVGSRNGLCRIGVERNISKIETLHGAQLGKRVGGDRNSRMLAQSLPGEEAKIFIAANRTAEASTKLLAFELRSRISGFDMRNRIFLVQLVVCVQRCLSVEQIRGSVKLVAPRTSDHIHRRAFGATIRSREALCR